MAPLNRFLAALTLLPALVLAADSEGSTLITSAPAAATCTTNGIEYACLPTATADTGPTSAPSSSSPVGPPVFDDSTIVCDSSSVVGSSLATLGKLLSNVCGNFVAIEHDTGSPKVVTVTAEDGNTVTFQLGWTFDGDHDDFGLTPEHCEYGFMYAIKTCTNSDRPLTSGGVAAAMYVGYRINFVVDVQDLRFERRDGAPTTLRTVPRRAPTNAVNALSVLLAALFSNAISSGTTDNPRVATVHRVTNDLLLVGATSTLPTLQPGHQTTLETTTIATTGVWIDCSGSAYTTSPPATCWIAPTTRLHYL